jgi:lipopolysaccharide biosynthesis protein
LALDRTYRELFEHARHARSGVGPAYVARAERCLDANDLAIKAVAFYLPQFHRIPENDSWWGPGFTEWTNVSKALPQFLGHYQPRLPGDLGFYDLRVPDVLREQVAMARQYGLYGFCFHYYWFAGHRLLERPLQQFLADRSLKLRFCLCWANENWTRRWDGSDNDVLIAQNHAPGDDIAFLDSIAPMLRDERYIRVDGKPLLIVYRASVLPDAAGTAARWRKRAAELGFAGLYLVAARSFGTVDPRPLQFDAAVDFPPHQGGVTDIAADCQLLNPDYRGVVRRYDEIADFYAQVGDTDYVAFRTVMPGWDNQARNPGAGLTFVGSTPGRYAHWLERACARTLTNGESTRLLFINGWNEWAECAYLEPDRRFGYAYLDATSRVLERFPAAKHSTAAHTDVRTSAPASQRLPLSKDASGQELRYVRRK